MKFKQILATSFSVSSSMIGSSSLLLPLLFIEKGLLFNLILLLLFGTVYGKTCSLWAYHSNHSEEDIVQTTERHLGKNYRKVLSLTSGVLLIMIFAVYYMLFNQTFYKTIIFILQKANVDQNSYSPSTQHVVFDRFSVQYLGIATILLALPVIFTDKIKLVVRFSSYGFAFLASLLCLYLVLAFIELFNGNLAANFHKLKLFPSTAQEVFETLGIYSLAFICHPTVLSSLRNNPRKDLNQFAIYLGYFFTILIYLLYGILGSFSFVGHQPLSKASSILDYMRESYLTVVTGLILCLYFAFIIGIFPYVAKLQLSTQFKQFNQNRLNKSISVAIVIYSLTMQLTNFSIGTAMSLIGAVVAILCCFIYPVLIHLRCLKQEDELKSILNRTQIEQEQKEQAGVCPNHNRKMSCFQKVVMLSILVFALFNMVLQIILTF